VTQPAWRAGRSMRQAQSPPAASPLAVAGTAAVTVSAAGHHSYSCMQRAACLAACKQAPDLPNLTRVVAAHHLGLYWAPHVA